MKKTSKKLKLGIETVKQLTEVDRIGLAAVAGGSHAICTYTTCPWPDPTVVEPDPT